MMRFMKNPYNTGLIPNFPHAASAGKDSTHITLWSDRIFSLADPLVYTISPAMGASPTQRRNTSSRVAPATGSGSATGAFS